MKLPAFYGTWWFARSCDRTLNSATSDKSTLSRLCVQHVHSINTILLSTTRSSKLSPSFRITDKTYLCTFHLCACYTPRLNHVSFQCRNIIRWRVKIMKFVVTLISPVSGIRIFVHSQALIVQNGPLASLFGVSWSHTYRHTVGLLWTSDQSVAEASTYKGQHNRQTGYEYTVCSLSQLTRHRPRQHSGTAAGMS
jgi:hypothetical protein